jgi:membrane protease subunit HflK
VRQIRVGYEPEVVTDTGTPPGQMLTGDQNLVNVQLVVDYAIGEADDDLDTYLMHREQVDAVLARAAEAAAGEWVAGRTIDQVLLTGSAALPAWVLGRLTERLPELRLGIRVQRVSVSLLAPPDEVRAAFEAVNQAQTAIRTRETQAQQEREQRLRQAEALKYKLGQEAAQYHDEQLDQARADAKAFRDELAAYRAVRKTNPDALAFLWWHEMQETLDLLKDRGSEVKPLDHYLQNGELNVYEVTRFFNPLRR